MYTIHIKYGACGFPNKENHIDDIPVLYGNEKSNSVLALLVKGFQLNSILFIYITFKV